MRFKSVSTALLLVATLSVWASAVPAAAGALARLPAKNGRPLASKTSQPFAYVAEICEIASSCPSANGLVQMLGGPAITSGIVNPTTLALDGAGNLYVGNATGTSEGNVTVYASKSVNLLRTLGGITGEPKGLVADAAGQLFVVAQDRVGCCQLQGTGEIYAPGGTQPQRNIQGLSGFAHSPVRDSAGTLYVGNFDVFPGWVSVYDRWKRFPSRVIATGIGLPIQLALAPNGDLVVLNGLFSGGYDVTVYPAGATAPSLTITAGLHASTSLAVDADGNVYVGNGRFKGQPGSVTVYLSGQTTVSRTIQTGITFPAALAFDGSGRLYVADVPRKGASSIAVYASGALTPLHTYHLAEEFAAMAVPQ
jgi:hypothetical protein